MAYVVCFPDGSTDTLLSDPENRNARLTEPEGVLRERLGGRFRRSAGGMLRRPGTKGRRL